jgi:hypothetical protein
VHGSSTDQGQHNKMVRTKIHLKATLDPNMSKRTVFDFGIGSMMETSDRWSTCYRFVFVMARLKLHSHGDSPTESHYGHLQVKNDRQISHHSSALEKRQFESALERLFLT